MIKRFVLYCLPFCAFFNSFGQQIGAPAPEQPEKQPVYKLKPGVEIPVTAVAAGWTIYAFGPMYGKDPSTTAQIQALRAENINGFDRWAADVYSEKAADVSDLLFYGSMPLPILLLADKDIRKDAGRVGLLYLQAMTATGVLYTGSGLLFNRYRPYTYNPSVPMEMRTGGGAKNSFFAGHVALVATSTFFMAKVYSDYHPDSQFKYVMYGLAIGATGATGYLRHRGGRHFPSDIVVGTAIGTLSGILVPHLHKTKAFKNPRLTLMPFSGRSHGLAMTYKL